MKETNKERNYVNMQVNPCKMCMPMGASQALKGFSKTMNIIHGSQGCSTYIRRHMAAHYNEPVDIASSSLSEEGTVYGGAKNLKLGIKNLVNMYKPDIVGVLTTCLAETIGDDINRIVKEVNETGEFEDVDIIPIPTPGYGGSQSEGYFAAITGILKFYGNKMSKVQDFDHQVVAKYEGNHVNIIMSNATCEDIREIKRVLKLLNIEGFILPDISDVFDAPYTNDYQKLCEDGVKREDIPKVFQGKATIELGHLVDPRYSPAQYLLEAYDIPAYRLPLPIGLAFSDQLIETLLSIYNIEMPIELEKERGRLLDAMIDSHKHSPLGKCAIFGDMDLVYGISGLVLENGGNVYIGATGSKTKRFKANMITLLESYENTNRISNPYIMQDSDFETIRDVMKETGVNLMIGSSDGKFIWEKDGIDLIRVGFPVHDHIGAQRKLRFGYKGSARLMDEIVNTLLDQKHKGYKERMKDAFYPKITVRMEESLWEM